MGSGGTVTALVTDGPAKAGDWLGLFDGQGALVTNYRDWKYLNGARKAPDGGVANAVVPFTLPLTEGAYELRLFEAGSFTVVATSPTITVSTSTVSVDKTSVSAGGTVTATIANAPGTVSDWVGLYEVSASSGSYRDWKYLLPPNPSSGEHLATTMASRIHVCVTTVSPCCRSLHCAGSSPSKEPYATPTNEPYPSARQVR